MTNKDLEEVEKWLVENSFLDDVDDFAEWKELRTKLELMEKLEALE